MGHVLPPALTAGLGVIVPDPALIAELLNYLIKNVCSIRVKPLEVALQRNR
jgi:hypothetical protein